MKKVQFRIACGVIVVFFSIFLLLIQVFLGIKILTEDNLFVVIIIILPVTLFLGGQLSKGYDEFENNDKLFLLILAISMFFLITIIILINKM
jgi:hypothetical protein